MHRLWYDYETTGTDPLIHGIMTAYFVIYDENNNKLDELELYLKPDKGEFVIEQEALDVTGIDPVEHLADPRTITYSEGAKLLMDMLKKHKIPKKRTHFRPCGQNIGFDEGFTMSRLVPRAEWRKLVHYTPIDTLIIITSLKDIGMLPKDIGNLGSLVEYFGLPMGKAHDCKEDVMMTVNVYKAITDLLLSLKNNGLNASSTSNSLLDIIEL